MAVATYPGVVHNGKIELSTPIDLPEGSEVYVIVPSTLNERAARRKATVWLVGYVGNMLMADHGVLVQSGPEWLWRFPVFITSLAHDPWGPIGCVEISAATGAVINDLQTKVALMDNGKKFKRPM